MIKKTIKRRIHALQNLRDSKRGKIPNAILGKVNNIVCREGMITQRATAENLINSIATNDAKKREGH
jgi:hypothetical protein